MSDVVQMTPGVQYPKGSGDYPGSIIQSPAINSSGEPTQRSVKDVGMARDIVQTVIAANRVRAIVNSRILAKYNAERPYDQYRNEQEGLGWRSNFTTKPLPGMIEKVAPRFVAAVDGLKYFTNASLSPLKWQNTTEKTSKFREAITKTIRNRKGFRTLIEDVAFDNALFGHTIVAWLDEFSWFPQHFKQNENFVTDGTKSDTRWAQVVVLKEVFLPHELFEQIKDKEAAEDAGFNLENCRQAINTASSSQIRDNLNTGGTLETWYQNAIRELTVGASYMAGTSVVVVWSLLVREVTGKVSHYRMAGPEMLDVFERQDRFDSMESCLSFFSFQKGNGTLHGSKGIGRDIYELAGMIDRTRNEIVDRMIMSGKTLVQGDMKRIHTFRMSVVGSTIIVPKGWDFIEQKIDGNVDGFLKLDAYFGQIVNSLIGSVSIPQVEGEAFRSPQAWSLLAEREEEGRDVRISRFMEQLTEMFQTMQIRLCDEDIDDDDAKAMQKELLEVMTREELNELAKQPVSGTIKDLTPSERQLIASIAAEKKGNPLYNQRQLEVEDLTAKVDAEFANKLLLPENDPTEHAEQDRQQQLELMLLSAGHPVPVSPRDNHLIHLNILMPAAEQLAGQIQGGQMPTAALEATAAHINEHYNQALAHGVKASELGPVKSFVDQIGSVIASLKALDAQADQHSQDVQSHIQGGSGIPPQEEQPPIPNGNPSGLP